MASKAEAAFTLLKQREGELEGTSEWQTIDQAQINRFADATLDHQFIHVDPEKAKLTPFKSTIAHGFLTLSLLPHFGESIPQPDPKVGDGLVMAVNYGLDRVRFMAPVKVGSRIRAHRKLISAEQKDPNTLQLKHEVTVEIEGHDKPACVAEALSRLVYQA